MSEGSAGRAASASLVTQLTQSLGPSFLEAVSADDMDEAAILPAGLLAAVDLARAAGFNHLLDIGATDHLPLTPRFEISYHFLALPDVAARSLNALVPARFRLRVFPDDLDPVVPSLCGRWPNADWPEREVWDLFGVRFDGHPDLKRILMPDDWEGHPLRKDYPLRGLNRRFNPGGLPGPVPAGGDQVSAADLSIFETEKDLTASPGGERDTLVLSMGPQHPSTHGVLRVMLRLDGETVVSAEPEIGFLHTGIEKQTENLFWQQAITVVDRADYLAPLSNSLCYVLAAERLLGIHDIPPRAQVLRVMFTELTRIASHLVWLGTGAMDLGAQSIFMYAFEMRERILDIMEFVTGARMHQSWFRVGGLAIDVPKGFLAKMDDFIARFPERLTDMRTILEKNVILMDRLVGVGSIDAQEAIAWGMTGPILRASGVPYDVRKARPYSGYETYDFDICTQTAGDCYARFVVRLDEMHQAWRIIKQAREKFPGGPVAIGDRKIVPPPKTEIQHSMEALIHHFKLVSSGFNVPEGHVYQSVESPRGELGMYVTSAGGNKPWRVRWRPPSFYNLQALRKLAPGNLIADVVAIIGSLDPVFGEVDR